ncbi:MAG: DNA translocase FtsK 4TM domain-containing protein [Paludibacteraceae bacterium]|nr:DNA translocase FtsK 4TM domain-containing protein [Paludibacteraceae bacterium]
MARRVTPKKTQPSKETKTNKTTTKPNRLKAFLQKTRELLLNRKFQISVGIIVFAITIMMFIAYVSFFFTGAEDQSIVEAIDTRHELRDNIQNTLGLPGAIVSRWLVHSTFGIVSIFALIAMALYSTRLVREYNLPRLRLLFITIFALMWGSITLGFAQHIIGKDAFFYWGGSVGKSIAEWGISYIHWLGMTIILITSLIVFLILVDKKFPERCKQFFSWLTELFKKKEKDEMELQQQDKMEGILVEDVVEDIVENVEDEILNIELTPEDELLVNSDNSSSQPVFHLDVEVPNEELITDDTPENVDISITDVPNVELQEETSEMLLEKLGPYDPRKDLEQYKFPSLNLLKIYDNETAPLIDKNEQQTNANRIVNTLRNFDIEIESIKATVGPSVTLYEIVPKAGIKIARIQGLENDIMLSLAAIGIRIIAPMPGKGTIGIEVPNEKPQIVSMHSVIASKRFQEEHKMKLPVAIGRTITNEVFTFDLAKTPHLLVAGATGQGKSVGLNAILTSLLYKKHPAELKFVLVDPKMVEFSIYKPLLKHYMAAMPDQDEDEIIITDCQKVINTLNSLVIEMENRYQLLMTAKCRNLEDYNEKFVNRKLNPERGHRYMPYIVIVIDEYGDFIMQAGKEVERPIQRLTQKARAVGMHMILATQRPDVKIVTGTIKANIPTRIAFRTQSVVDSRTVLDSKGADQLIGKGDMLYSASGAITRIQCAFVDTPEVEKIVQHIEQQQHYLEPYQLPEYIAEGSDTPAPGSVDLKRLDPMFADVARYTVSKQEGSTSRIQRAFEIGYNRAGKLSDQLEAAGIVGPNKGPKGRDVLIQDMEQLERKLQELGY